MLKCNVDVLSCLQYLVLADAGLDESLKLGPVRSMVVAPSMLLAPVGFMVDLEDNWQMVGREIGDGDRLGAAIDADGNVQRETDSGRRSLIPSQKHSLTTPDGL